METYIEDDDWENIVIPDLLSEREKQLLEERRRVEESDTELSKELFSKDTTGSPLLFTKETRRDIEMPREINTPIKTRPNLIRPDVLKSQKIKQKKVEHKRITEIFGEANIDCHYELYGHIENKY